MDMILKLTRDTPSRSFTWINFQHVLTFEESSTGGTVIFLAADKTIRIQVTEAPAQIEQMLTRIAVK
jgi:hypothetical protein